ncbi:O-antigen ligase family protein [Mixta calida]
MINYLIFLYAFFYSLPLVVIDFLPAGVKLDDVILIFLLVILIVRMFLSKKKEVISRGVVLFLLLTLLFSTISLIKSINYFPDQAYGDSGYTVYARILQSLLIILFVCFLANRSERTINFFKKGFLLGSTISLAIFFSYFFENFNLNTFASRGVYFTKDIFQYNPDAPFFVHVNTLGSFFLMSFFLLYDQEKYNIYKVMSFFFLLPSLLLIAKGDILALFLFFIVNFYQYKRFRVFFYYILLPISLFLAPVFYSLYQGLSQYRVYSSGRDEIYGAAIDSIFNSPFGYGLGVQNEIIFQKIAINFPAHNILLSVGLELGLIYLFIVILYFFVWFFNHRKAQFQTGIVICYVIIGLFGNAMYFYKFHTLILAMTMLGIIKGVKKNESRISP